jgi:ribulose-5-phosphate 4-epimerase/fuculose-1-phosphate aldolase
VTAGRPSPTSSPPTVVDAASGALWARAAVVRAAACRTASASAGPELALIGDDSIGRGIVETLAAHRSPAVLMRNHGVFTVGKNGQH